MARHSENPRVGHREGIAHGSLGIASNLRQPSCVRERLLAGEEGVGWLGLRGCNGRGCEDDKKVLYWGTWLGGRRIAIESVSLRELASWLVRR